MSFGGALPTVGAQVVIQGLAQFTTAQRQVVSGLNQMNKASYDLSQASAGGWRVASAAATAGSAAIVAATAAAVTAVVDLGAQYQKALRPALVFGKATGDQAKQLSRDVLELSRDYTTSAKDIAEASGDLARAGVSYQELHDGALEATQAMVAVSNAELDAGRAAELVAQAMFSYRNQQLGAVDAANKMIGAVMASTGNWQDLYLSFKQIIPLAAQLNIPFDQLATTMAVMWQEGVRGETAGTSIRNALLKMINPTKEVIQVMTMYGLKLFDVRGQFIGMRPFIEQLNAQFGDQAVATGKVTQAQAEMALGSLGLSRSMLALLVLAKGGTQTFDDFNKKINEADFKQLNRDLTQTLLDQLGLVINQIKAFSITFTEGFIDTLTGGVRSLNQFLRSFSLDTIKGFSQAIGGVFAQVGQLKDAFLNTTAMQNVFKGLSQTFTALVTVARNFGETLAAVWNNPGVRKFLSSILDGFNKLLGVTSGVGDNILDKILVAVVAVSEAIKTGVVELLQAIPWDSIATGITQAFDKVTTFFEKDLTDLFNSWQEVAIQFWNNLPKLAQQGIDQLVSYVGSLVENIQTGVVNAFNSVVSSITGFVSNVITGLDDALDGLLTGIASMAEGAYNVLAGMADDIWKTFQYAFAKVLEGVQPLIDFFNNDMPGALKVLGDIAKGVIVVAVVAYKVFEQYSQKTQEQNDKLGQSVGKVWEGILPFVNEVINDMGKSFTAWWNQTISDIRSFFDYFAKGLDWSLKYWIDYWTNVVKGAGDSINWIVSKLGDFFDWLEQQAFIGDYVKQVRKSFRDSAAEVDDFFKKLGAAPGDLLDNITKTWDDVTGNITSTLGGAMDEVSKIFSGIGVDITQIFADAQSAVANMLPNVGGAVKNVQDFIAKMMESARASIARTQTAIDKVVRSIKDSTTTIGKIDLVPMKPGGGAGINPADLEPKGADPTTQRAEWEKFIKKMLQGIPMMTDEFAKFVAEITEVDPSRLQPIVGFMRSQAGLLHDIGASLQKQLEIELKIAQVDEQLDKLANQREKIELERAYAMLPFDIKEHELAQKKVIEDLKALPIEQKIAEIDKEISLAQRENLDLAKARLLVQQAMLPLQNSIADIDKQIALINRENYAAQRQLLLVQQAEAPIQQQIEDIERRRQAAHRENFNLLRQENDIQQRLLPLNEQVYQIDQQINRLQRENYDVENRRLNTQIQMLPIQNRLEDIDKRIAAAQKTNYDLVVREAQANAAILPFRQEMERLDKQISAARQDNYDLEERRLRVQIEMTDKQTELRNVETRLNELQRTNFDIEKRQADLDAQALDSRMAIRDLEKEISDIVDKRQQLEMQRDELIAQHSVDLKQRELDRVTKQLDDLWAQFNFRSEAGMGGLAGALIPGIVDLERQKNALEDMLKGLTTNLDNIHDQQQDINYQDQLSTITLQLQEEAQKAILKPIQDRIDLLERQKEVEQTLARVTELNLQQQKDLIEAQLKPYQDIIDSIDQQNQLQELNTNLVVTGLQRQKSELQRLIQPYQDVIDQIDQTKATTQAQQDLTIAGLQRERELLLGQLQPYQDILDSINRQTTLTDLYNQLAINGLERQKQRVEDLLTPLLAQQHSIEQIQAVQQLQFDAADINYREELQHLNDLLTPLESKRIALERETAAQQLQRDITITFLNEQKQGLEDALRALQNQMDAIDRATTSEQIQRDLTLNYLDAQKRKLEDMLIPINNARTAIENETASLQLQRTQIDLTYQLQLDNLQKLVLPLQIYKNSLDANLQSEKDTYNFLLQAFQDAINKSGLFTQKEQEEIPKRLNLWGSEVSKTTELRDRLNDVSTALTGNANAYAPLPGKVQPVIDIFNTNKDRANDLRDAFNNLVSSIGDNSRGIILGFNNLINPTTNVKNSLGDANTAAGNLRTALNDVSAGTTASNIDNLKFKFSGNISSLEQYVNNARSAVNSLRDWLYGQSWSLAQYMENTREPTQRLIDRLAGTNVQSISWATDDARFATQDLGNALIGGGSLADKMNQLSSGGAIDTLRNKLYDGIPGNSGHLHGATSAVTAQLSILRDMLYGQSWSIQISMSNLWTYGVDTLRQHLGSSVYDSGTLIASVYNNKIQFNDWRDAINNAAQALRTFPTGYVNVTKTFAEGGVVPGMYNQPTLAVVHGGERVIPVSAGVGPYEPSRAQAASSVVNNTIINYNYNMSASYERYQDPITIDQNLRTIVALSRR